MAYTASDKIQITTSPALPATCAVCHCSADGTRKFIDFQADLDFYGAIVICESCIINALEILGFVPETERDEILTNAEIVASELIAVREQNAELQSALDAILRVRPDLSDHSDSVDLDESGLDAPIED